MWKAVVLAVSLLMAGSWATEVQPEFGVKLCGREFIRAVIFTCGGSRWRRVLATSDDASLNPFSAHRDQASDRWTVPGLPAPLQLQEPATPVWPRRGKEEPLLGRDGRSASLEDVLEALQSSERRERDAVVGLSSACCKLGCSKNEISSLC